jgi:hypothetical protein
MRTLDVVAVGLFSLLSACGGSDASEPTSLSTTTISAQDAMFEQCVWETSDAIGYAVESGGDVSLIYTTFGANTPEGQHVARLYANYLARMMGQGEDVALEEGANEIRAFCEDETR